ncbi:MAG: hypothetical protein JXR77_11540 [Lentisphaeria bacterium]|nr:hypothetical protein [Lentisphaeria bacterium]
MNALTCRFHAIALGALVAVAPLPVHASPARVARALADDAVEAAAKLSGRSVTPAARAAAREAVERAAVRHGDDALRALRRGGIELSEAAATHGDDIWRFAAACPQGARALALRPSELLPLVRDLGPDVLRLDAKAPGLSTRAIKVFGRDAIPVLAARVPAADVPRLVGFAERANTPAAAQALLDQYLRKGPMVLERLDWKVVMAVGLSTAAVVAAHETSDGVQESLQAMSENSPDMARRTILGFTGQVLRPYTLGVSVLVIGWALLRLRRWGFFRRAGAKATAHQPRTPGPGPL